VRLIYLDEAGTDRLNAPYLCVAGVIIHGDNEWPEVDRRIEALVDKYIPPERRYGFAFHATDIYHGTKEFDRRKPEWADRGKRNQLLRELAGIIEDLCLPVVSGEYEKKSFGDGLSLDYDKVGVRHDFMHNAAAINCLFYADRWLARFAPSELATIYHEDGTPAKAHIKKSLRALRSREFAAFAAKDEDMIKAEVALPLKRIIDTVNFQEKSEARPLQLADLCAFIIGRHLKGKPVPEAVLRIIRHHQRWMPYVKEIADSSSDDGGFPASRRLSPGSDAI
jgi:hypothetical protein